MNRITKEVQINTPQSQVWEVLSDLTTIAQYDPMVTQAYYTSQINEGVGASRHCDLLEGGYVKERITVWQPGEGYALTVYEDGLAESPFVSQTAQFNLAGNGDATAVTLSFEYELKADMPGDQMQLWMDEALSGLLTGLKVFVETGESIPLPAAETTR